MESLKKGSDLVGGRGGKLGSNQVPLRNKEFKLTVDYTRVVWQKKQQKVCSLQADHIWQNER